SGFERAGGKPDHDLARFPFGSNLARACDIARSRRALALQARTRPVPRAAFLWRGIQRLQQRLNHKRGSRDQVPLDERCRNTQDAEASPNELRITTGVVSALRPVAHIPVDLDDERGFTREEVDDVIANDDLPPKLYAEETASPH